MRVMVIVKATQKSEASGEVEVRPFCELTDFELSALIAQKQ